MNTERNRRHCRTRADAEPIRRSICYITSSKSQSNPATTTTNIDSRVVGGDNSTNISAHGSTIQLTDAGAVGGAFGFAREAVKDAFDFATGNQTRATAVLTSAIEGVSKNTEQLKDAYETAKAGEQKVLVGVAVAIVAVVGVAALRGRG